MGIALKIFSLFLLLFIVKQACGASCSPSDIVVRQSKTGRIVEGKLEFQVSISNNCECTQSQVIVKCFGLSSVEPVDPKAIKPIDGERCIVNNGRPIAKGTPIFFKYAWLTPQDFPVVSSKSNC